MNTQIAGAKPSADVNVVRMVLSAYPDALKKGDEAGRLPLHASIEHGASFEVFQNNMQNITSNNYTSYNNTLLP